MTERCSKVPHNTLASAEQHLKLVQEPLKAYKCLEPGCPFWHVGHPSRNVKTITNSLNRVKGTTV